MHRSTLALVALFALAGCGAGEATQGQDSRRFPSPQGEVEVRTVARGLEHPWGLAFLPDGRMLVTERPGRLRIVSADGSVSAPVEGVPAVYARGQGGLLDVAVDPDFAKTPWVYLSYAEPGEGGGGTAVARGRLEGNALADVQVIFRQAPKLDTGHHFGSRLVFARDGRLFVTDLVGIVLILPVTRPVARRLLTRVVERRLLSGRNDRRPGPPAGGPVVRGDVV